MPIRRKKRVIYIINYHHTCFWCRGYLDSDEGVERAGDCEKNYYSADYDEYGGAYVRRSIFPRFASWYSRGCVDGVSFLAHFNLDNAV